MDLGQHYEDFTNALLHGYYSEGELEMFVRFDLGEDLDHIVGGSNLREKVFSLIKWADARGRADELFAAALERKPNNPKLKELASTMATETEATHVALADQVTSLSNKDLESANASRIRTILSSYSTTGALEAMIVTAPSLGTGQEVKNWRTLMRESENRICSIAGSRYGTGFLVGEDRIITNSHVVKYDEPLDKFDVAFDYMEGTNRDELPKYKLEEELARSDPREYDFAIFRLNKTPNGDRGYFKPKSYQFKQIREPVSILGHPNGEPLSFSFGVVFDQDSFMGRVAYTANTAGGSSGSPVFRENWDLVAIHHHGEENVNNHGIPMKKILGFLREQGKSNLLGEA